MKRFILTIVAILCIANAVNAGTTFTFDDGGLGYADLDSKISQYMTAKYGNSVTTTNVFVAKDNNFNPTYFLSTFTYKPGWFAIDFGSEPISSASFDWYVFEATYGVDFHWRAYDEYGNIVNSQYYYCDSYTGGHVDTFTFGTPVRRLYFSNSGSHDIAIDNLVVNGGNTAIPAPGAILLGTVGAGLVGWLRRRRTL